VQANFAIPNRLPTDHTRIFVTRSPLDSSLQIEFEPTPSRYKLELPYETTGICFRAAPYWPFRNCVWPKASAPKLLLDVIAAAARWSVKSDSSKRGLAEEALRDQEEKFRAAADPRKLCQLELASVPLSSRAH